MIVDALGDIVVPAERRGTGNSSAVLILLGRQRIAAGRASALDAEQVVIPDRQLALAPARFVDGLRDRHRRGNAVFPLGRNRSWRDVADERFLRVDVLGRSRSGHGCGPGPVVQDPR